MEKIKNLFLSDLNNTDLRNLYFEIRSKELDPINIYPIEYIYEQIENEVIEINSRKK